MLRSLGVDNSTSLFQQAGAPFVAALLKALGPDFNAVLVNDLGKGAVLLGIDLGASFLAEVCVRVAVCPKHIKRCVSCCKPCDMRQAELAGGSQQ